MKRILAICAFCLLLLSLACAPLAATTATAAPAAATAEAVATPAPTPEPTPEPLGLAPIDLLGKGYNPFYNEVFPAGYTVFGAQYYTADSHTGAKDTYLLDLTAEGNPADIAKTCAGILGVTDETQLSTYLASLDKDNYVVIEGTYAGQTANVAMKKTSADAGSDLCTEVDGCRVEFAVEIDAVSAQNACALVLANYSTAALGDLAARFGEDTIHMDQLSIFVNTQKPEKTLVTVYYTIEDAAALLVSIKDTLQTSWFDEANSDFGLQYGKQNITYNFNLDNSVVQVSFSPNDNATPASEFKLSEKSLTKFGFQHFPQDGLAIYKEDQNHLEIAFAKPGWGHVEDWNFEFLGESNGYFLGMWYTEATGLFHVTVSKGDKNAAAEYIVAENAFEPGAYPDEETLKLMFSEAAGITEGDYRAAVFALFTNLIQDRFGMTWQELYALPTW